MLPSDWLMQFLASGSGGWLDPVRIQKGMFLLAMREALPPGEAYRFEPYAYGPMSRTLYRDIRSLRRDGLIEGAAVGGATWELLRATPEAGRLVAKGREQITPTQNEALVRVREEVEALSFADLLESVYDQHPEYAVRSVFRRGSR